MLTASAINKKLEVYMESQAGKERIKREMSTNPQLIKKQSDNYEEAVALLKEVICRFAPPAFHSGETLASIEKMIDGAVSDPIETEDGYNILVDFAKESLKRPSLSENSSGAYDILGLMTQGWAPKHTPPRRVIGLWHDAKVIGLTHREGNDFIQRAVDYFMAMYAEKYRILDIDINPLYVSWNEG